MFQAFTKKLLLVYFLSQFLLIAEDISQANTIRFYLNPLLPEIQKKSKSLNSSGLVWTLLQLENQLNSWEKKLPADIDFWRSPIT